MILQDRVVTEVLDLARQHQRGRVTSDVTTVTSDNVVTQILDLAKRYQQGRVTGDVTHDTFD